MEPPLVSHRMSSTPDPRYLAVAVGKAIALLDRFEGRWVYRDVAHRDYVDAWDIRSDGRLWATGSRDGFVRFWTFPECKPTGQVLRIQDGVHALRFSPDGTKLVTGGMAGVLQVWDLIPEITRELRDTTPVKSIRWLPGGKRYLVHDAGKRMRLHDAEEGAPLGLPLEPGEGHPYEVFSEDGKFVAVIAGAIEVLDLETGRRVGDSFLKDASAVGGFLPDGRVLVKGKEGRAWIWNPGPGEVEDLPAGEYELVSGRLLEAVGDRVRLKELSTGATLAEANQPVKRIWRGEEGSRVLFEVGQGHARIFTFPELVPEGPEITPESEASIFLF